MNPIQPLSFDLENPEDVSALDELSLWSAPFGYKLLNIIRMNNVKRVLDLGCGTGFPAIELAMRYGTQTFVSALDPWSAALVQARKRASQIAVENIEFIEGVGEAIPFPDETFDVIVSNNGINNVQDLDQTLREIRRVAKPGAQFAFTFNTERTMIEFYEVFQETLSNNQLPVAIDQLNRHIHEKRPPVDQVKQKVTEVGFQVKNIQQDEFQFVYASGTAMFHHFFIRLAFLPPWQALVPEGLRQAVFDEIEQRLNQISQQKGRLTLTIPFVLFDCCAN